MFGDALGQWLEPWLCGRLAGWVRPRHVLAHGVARDPEPPGDLPQGGALDPTKVLTWRPYSPARLISSSGHIQPSHFSRAVTAVHASPRESATSCRGEPLGTPGTKSHLFQEGVCADFPPPQWQGCRHHRQHDILGSKVMPVPGPCIGD